MSFVVTAGLEALLDRDGCEFVNGEFIERNYGCQEAALLTTLSGRLWQPCERRGWLLGANAGYQCYAAAFPDDPERCRRPSLSFIERRRLPKLPKGTCNTVPDLAVEVISPSDSFAEIDIKVWEYQKVGVKLVWVIVPDTQTVHVHRINGTTPTLRGNDELSGEDVVPGFKCCLPELFAFNEDDVPATA